MRPETSSATAVDPNESDHRERLQHALGADYELGDVIGRGGFGVVYSARDRRLDRDVAVKALRHDLFPTRLLLERFQREAKAVARLRHANILPVYNVGEGDGLAFMIMPLIRGESLSAFLKRGGRLEPDEAVRIGIDVARALDAAHRVGIVHRDVKPENIMLEGDERHALLADFGIAKAMGHEGEMTGSGVVIGSPQYMSPEQAAAERDIDARSDVYSLGAVVFEMLAGRRIYEAASYQQFLVQQFTTEPPGLSQLVPSLPAGVGTAVMRALARGREQRWRTAADFAAALAAAAREPAMRDHMEDSWFARRGLLVALVLLLFFYANTTTVVLATFDTPGMQSVVDVFREPLLWVFKLALLALLAELLFTTVRAWRSGRRGAELGRVTFGQPRWWQPWYPRVLRHPENVWDRMPMSMKLLRTILWLALASIPVGLPLIYVVPGLQEFATGVGVALPVSLRAIIYTSIIMQRVHAELVLLTVPIGALLIARRRSVPLAVVARLLVTWREDRWTTPDGQRLLRHR